MSERARADALLARLRSGQDEALGELFDLHHSQLERLLFVRMDARLARRIAPEDVLQEAFIEVARRIGEYLANPTVPFYVWLRFLILQRLQQLQRAHLGARKRAATLEVALPGEQGGFLSSDSLASQLVGHLTSPSQAAIRTELQARLREALDAMTPLDREILTLRHFEELANEEVAAILGISKDAASKRHVRALVRLREVLTGPDGTLCL
jgi:RNA polymerase sigma-70 factor (ECF subfamily)